MAGWRYAARRRERKVWSRGKGAGGGLELVSVPSLKVAAALGDGGTGAPLVLVAPGGYRIEVGEGFVPSTLTRLLDTLEGAGCLRFPRG